MAAPPATAGNVVTTGNPYAIVMKLAMPTVLAMLSQSIVNEIDIVFFSWLPPEEGSIAQAALFPSLIILWAFGGSLSAISVGTQAIAARRFAEGDKERSGGVLLNSWLFATGASVAFTILGYLTLPLLLRALISVPAVHEAAESYLQWRLLGVTSMVVTFSFKAFFDGIGKTHVHMWSAIVMNIVNVLLCWMFIFGNWGAPAMGIAGAGLAALLSTWIGLFIMVAWAFLPDYRSYHPFKFSKVNMELIRAILRLSVPSGVATLAVMSGFGLFSKIVSELDKLKAAADEAAARAADLAGHASETVATVGQAAADASQLLGSTEAINSAATTVIIGILKPTLTACLAFGTSTATLVSQSLGEKDPKKAAHFGWVSVRIGLIIFGLIGFLEGVVFPEQIVAFLSSSPAVQQAALGPMRMMGIITPMIAVGMILTQALFGAGNSLFVMIVELILHFACLVPMAYFLGIHFNYGLMGIWSSAVIYVVLLTAIMAVKFKSGAWQKIEL